MEQLQTAEARRFKHTVCRQQLSSACEKVLQVGERDGVLKTADTVWQMLCAGRLAPIDHAGGERGMCIPRTRVTSTRNAGETLAEGRPESE